MANITIQFNPLKNSNNLIIPKPMVITPQSDSGAPNALDKVTISREARIAQAMDKQKVVSSETIKAEELRSMLSKYDFNNITPRQMADLGGELFKRGEISQDVACSFIGTEKDTIVEIDENKPINMNKHFDFMLSAVTDVANKETGWEFGLTYRQNASKVLNDIQSFVQSDRLHIAT